MMPSVRKPHNDRAGYVASLRSGADRGWVVIYEADSQGLDVGARYAVVCESHGTCTGAGSMMKARRIMKSVDFCEECQR